MTRWFLFLLIGLGWSIPSTAQSVPDPSESPLWHAAVTSRGMPAVSGTRVFALSRDHEVLALSLDDGHELWRRPTGEREGNTAGFRVAVEQAEPDGAGARGADPEARGHVTTSGAVRPVWRTIPAMASAAAISSASISGVSAARLPPTGS